MSSAKSATVKPFDALRSRVRDLKLLVKFRLTLTIVLSSVLAYLIVAGTQFNGWALLVLLLGGFFTTSAANTLNQVLERDYDCLMKRTSDRPLAAGRMTVPNAVLLAGIMSLVGVCLLALFNPWTAFLGTLALVSYAFVYTPMKRVSPDAVTIGAVPGALPILIGSAAAEGYLSWLGFSLFAIQFFWQFPHFYAISFLGYDDYRMAGYQLVPERSGEPQFKRLALGALLCSTLLVVLSFAPFYLGQVSIIAAIAVSILSSGFAFFAFRFYQQQNRKTALGMLFYSFVYIPLAFTIFWIDVIL